MMKMATGEGSPLQQGAGTSSREVFGGYRGLRRRTLDLLLSLMFLGYMGIYRQKKSVGGASRGPRDRGARPGGGRALLSPGLLEASLTCTPSLPDHVRSKNHAPEGFIPFGLGLIFFFCETLK